MRVALARRRPRGRPPARRRGQDRGRGSRDRAARGPARRARHLQLRSRAVAPEDLVFAAATGAPWNRTNARQRVILPVVEHADELLAERGQPGLPDGVTADKLRHTFASVLVMLVEDPAHVMGQLGHTDPAFTLRIYTHAMRRDEGAKPRLFLGDDESPQMHDLQTMGAAGFEPATSRV